MSTWNDLSIREKAGFIKIGVDNGLTSLSDIQGAYNKFAEGGAFGNKQVKKFKDGGEEKKYEVTQGYHIVGDPEYVDNDVIQRDQYGNLLNPYTGGYGPARVPEVEVVGYGNGRAYYTNPNDRRLAELIRDENRRKEAYRQIYGTDEGFYMSPFAISDKPLKTVSPEFDLITMGGMGKDILKVGKNLFKLRKMPVSYTGVPKEFVADFMEYEPRDFYTKESKKVVKELAEKGITPEDQNIFTIALGRRAPKSNNWGRERGATFEWELSPDKQKIVGYKGDNTSIYTSDNINIAKSHLNNSPEGKIFKIYDKGTGKEFHIKSPKEEFGISDHPYYGEPWYEWDNIPITVDPYTQEIVKIPIDNWEFGKVVPTYRPYTPQTTSSLMSNLRNLGYSQLRTDRVNMNYPGYQYPITERIYTTAKDIIKAPLEEPMWKTALRTSNINLPYTVANATLGAGNVLYDYTKALGGHIYDGETEDNQQMSTTNPPQGYISNIGGEYTIRDDVDLNNYIDLLRNESFEGAKSDIAALRDIINRRHTPETFGISANSIYGPILSNMDKGERDRITQSYLNSALNMLRYGSIFDPQWEDQWWMLKDLKDDPRYDATVPWLYHGLPQATYLMSPQDQYNLFMDQGWKYLGKGQYNLVKNAAKRHKKYGKEGLPTYQIKEDAYDRNDVMPITNIYDSESGRQISEILPKDAQLPDPGFYPGTLYYNGATGNFAVKGEDLNDYGGNFGMLAPFADLGNELDKEGSPVVVTTGIQPAVDKGGNPITLDTLLNNQDNPYYAGYLQAFNDALAKQGIHTEYIDGYRYFMSPGFTVTPNGVTPNGYAWGGNLYKDGGSENNSSGGGGGIPLYLPEDTGNKTLDKVMKVANIVGDFVPVLGSARSIQTAVQDPSLANIGSAILNVAGDVSGFGLISKAVKGIRMAKNAQRLKEATMTYNHAEDAAALQREITKTLGRSKVNRSRQKALNRARNQARTNMDKARAVVKKGVKTPKVRATERITAGTNTVKTGVQDVKKL